MQVKDKSHAENEPGGAVIGIYEREITPAADL
jgi:hypothetical protein